MPPNATFCPACGQRVGPFGWTSGPARPEEILAKEGAIAYRGWMDGLRMSIPFAGRPGRLALTSHRLVFVRGTFRGKFATVEEMNEALARQGGYSFPLRDIVDAATDNETTMAIGGAYARLAVRVNGPTGPEAHTFVIDALVPAYLGMDVWVIAIENARKNGGVVPVG